MANAAAIRQALIKLMQKIDENSSTKPSERSFRTQFEDVGEYGEPTVGEVVNKAPTKDLARQQAIEGPAGDFAFGTFPDDPASKAVRDARIKANAVQGSDPLGDVGVHGRPRRFPEESTIGNRDSSISKDPNRLPDASRIQSRNDFVDDFGPAPLDETQSKELFQQLFDVVARGQRPNPQQMSSLADSHPVYHDLLIQEMKELGMIDNSKALFSTGDDIPF